MNDPMPASRWPWRAALAMHALLALGVLAWAGGVIGVLLVLPLLAATPGLLRQRRYTAGWLTLLLVFYVAGLLSEAFSLPARKTHGLALSAIAAIEFVSLVLFVRLAAREAAANAGPAAPAGSSGDA